ncbi:hypothetical protein [Desulfovibrio sp. ZJ200]|uniref:hypothetical protein n=1 Tax=Desulfovibrio sp. ZJ200 TaxID=2709792 RepID=UPI0013EA42C5|nr:hypothetical protein [Desulfovibrio sp. ZJ200]
MVHLAAGQAGQVTSVKMMLLPLGIEHFHFENALLTRKRQPPQRGVHSGENRVFRLNATFDFHKKSKVICSRPERGSFPNCCRRTSCGRPRE